MLSPTWWDRVRVGVMGHPIHTQERKIQDLFERHDWSNLCEKNICNTGHFATCHKFYKDKWKIVGCDGYRKVCWEQVLDNLPYRLMIIAKSSDPSMSMAWFNLKHFFMTGKCSFFFWNLTKTCVLELTYYSGKDKVWFSLEFIFRINSFSGW